MENRNLFKICLLLEITTFLFSCDTIDNPKERNKLVFKDNITSLTDSVNAMDKLLLKSKNRQFTYGIDVDMNNSDRVENQFFLYIDNTLNSVQNAGMISDSLLYKSKYLEFIAISERKRFVGLALYLNKNHISSCNPENGKIIYMYRTEIYMADMQTDLDRFIVFANSEQEINLNRYKILDSSNHLYLLANKGARIWCTK